MATVASLHIYPIKSCAGIELPEACIVETGFAHDREWMIVDQDGRFITQREAPSLARVRCALTDSSLALSIDSHGRANVPLYHEGALRQVSVWRSACPAFDSGEEVAQLLSEYLMRPVRMVRFAPGHRRLSDPGWTGGLDAPNLFSDGYPLLVLSEASVGDLSARVGRPLPVDRFRPNIVLGGVRAYAEDEASELCVGEIRLRLTKPCTRCVVTTTDQKTGERDGEEPLRTLKTYRYDARLRGVVFGRNTLIEAGHGSLLRAGATAQLS